MTDDNNIKTFDYTEIRTIDFHSDTEQIRECIRQQFLRKKGDAIPLSTLVRKLNHGKPNRELYSKLRKSLRKSDGFTFFKYTGHLNVMRTK